MQGSKTGAAEPKKLTTMTRPPYEPPPCEVKQGINRVWWDLRTERTTEIHLRTTPVYAPDVPFGPEGWRKPPALGRLSALVHARNVYRHAERGRRKIHADFGRTEGPAYLRIGRRHSSANALAVRALRRDEFNRSNRESDRIGPRATRFSQERTGHGRNVQTDP